MSSSAAHRIHHFALFGIEAAVPGKGFRKRQLKRAACRCGQAFSRPMFLRARELHQRTGGAAIDLAPEAAHNV
jgi:hypothetical protein